jgi:PhoH-like ATPase
LQSNHLYGQVTLLSKCINLWIHAVILGIRAEDYYNDRTLDDVNLLYDDAREMAADF